jgi:hypothetical protein
VLNPFEGHVRPELKRLDDLLSREFGVPLPQLANADSIGCSVIEIPADVFVHGTAPRGILPTFLKKCPSPSVPKRVRSSHGADYLLAREIGTLLI